MKGSKGQEYRAHFPGMKSKVGPVPLLIGILFVIVLLNSSRHRASQPAALMATQLAETGTPTAALTLVPTPTPIVTPIGECIWVGYARAFVDENANGQQEASELTLAGATFFVDDVLNNFTKVATAVSEASDSAELIVWLPGCPEFGFEVYVELPQGYAFTTPPRVKVPKGSYGDIYFFGFKQIDATPTTGKVPGMPGTGKLDIYVQLGNSSSTTPVLPSPTPARSPGVTADCIWNGKAEAFIDTNTNGLRDIGELPLPGVSFRIEGNFNTHAFIEDDAVTDEQGSAKLYIWLPGCPDVDFVVYAQPPADYSHTTPQPAQPTGRCCNETLQFGFKSIQDTHSVPEQVLPGMPSTGRLDDSMPVNGNKR